MANRPSKQQLESCKQLTLELSRLSMWICRKTSRCLATHKPASKTHSVIFTLSQHSYHIHVARMYTICIYDDDEHVNDCQGSDNNKAVQQQSSRKHEKHNVCVTLRVNQSRATERHLPYWITPCCLPPDTGECTHLNPSQAHQYLSQINERLSWLWRLVIYRDGLPVCTHPRTTRPRVEQLHLVRPTR